MNGIPDIGSERNVIAMKRILGCALLLLTLCGCGFLRENTYVAVTPHDEDYGITVDSNVLTVNSYLSLKNALINMVEDGVKEGVIRAEAYGGNLPEDLSQAVEEVSRQTPLGAYAVSSMTYDYSKIVSYYEIHVNTTFRRSLDEIQSVVYVTDLDALELQLRETMKNYETKLVVRVGDYESFDLENMITGIYEDEPAEILEKPSCSMEQYPDSGTQRILEIDLSYEHSTQELLDCRDTLQPQIEQLARIYGSSDQPLTNVRRFYQRLGRDAVLEPQDEGTHALTNSVYGVLVEGHATSYGFAQAFRVMMDACEIPCQLITGQRDGMLHYWCLVQISGSYYYIDPSTAAGDQGEEYYLMGNIQLEERNYYRWNAVAYPVVELPAELIPPEEETE